MIGEPVTTSAHDADSCDDIDGPAGSGGTETGRTPRHPWTDWDRTRLRTMCEQNLPSADIAERLGRTQRAVDAMSLRMGIRRHESVRPWSEAECALILRLHAEGANWAAIAGALPERSAIAVFRKLRHLVGPAPFKTAGQPPPQATAPEPQANAPTPQANAPERQVTVTERQVTVPERQVTAPDPSVAALPPKPPAVPMALRPSRPRPPMPLPPAAVSASVDTMIRWLRSRDFMVVRGETGWRVDHRVLATTQALLDFVNVRRTWLRLPPFALLEAGERAAPEVRGPGAGRGASRFGALSFR